MKTTLAATLWALVAITMVLTVPRVSVRVAPNVLSPGGSLTVTCKVPKDARNRQLEIAIVGYTSHIEPLNGEDAPSVRQMVFTRVPCGVDEAWCVVNNEDVAKAKFLVGGCE